MVDTDAGTGASRGRTRGADHAGDDARVRTWPWVSLNIRREHIDEWSALARALRRSRADLLREALEQVGLPYARAVAANRALPHGTRPAGGATARPRARRGVGGG